MILHFHNQPTAAVGNRSFLITRIIWSLLFSVLFTACKKDPPEPTPPPAENFYLRLSHTAMQAGASGSELTLKVEANSAWTISMPAGTDWLQSEPATGSNNADVKLKVLKTNNTNTKRSVTLTASLNNGKAETKQVVVEQEGVPINPVSIIWKNTLGGSGNDLSSSIIKTPDGGHLVAGRTSSSNNGDVGATKGAADIWVVKLNDAGAISWQKALGGNGNEAASAAAVTPDGGYVITGYTASSNNGDVGQNHGNLDFWVVKLNSTGAIQWQKTLGGSGDDWPHAITVTSEGKIAVAGFTKSNNNGDVGTNHGQEDYWVVMLENTNGNVVWKKVLGGDGSEIARSLVGTDDGGIIVGGTATSNNNGDVPATKGSIDFWIVRLDKNGNPGWKATLGGNNLEELNTLALGPDNTLVAAGYTRSNNGDVSGAKGSEDFWIVQLNSSNGAVNWRKTLGGTAADVARSALVTANGTIVVAGHSYSNNTGDVGQNAGAGDFWVIALDNSGNVIWKKLLGGDDEEQAFGIAAADNGSYVITGYTHSHNSGEVGANHGNSDIWTVKLRN